MQSHDRQIVVMGVMGAGKTTIGRLLAAQLDCRFYDADDFHSPESIAKMRGGVALAEEDRQPWIERVASLIAQLHARGETAVLACSSLTRSIRDRISTSSDRVVFVHLHADPAVIAARLAARRDHFADPALLESQYATLEIPSDALRIDASGAPLDIVATILQALGH